MSERCPQSDLTGQRIAWLLWGVPAALLIAGAFLGSAARTLVWTPALLVAGVACVVNAAHCRRLHCYLTGPLYLLAAGLTVLSGLDLVALPWTWIGGAIAGGTVLAHVPEWIGVKYLRAGQPACATKGGDS